MKQLSNSLKGRALDSNGSQLSLRRWKRGGVTYSLLNGRDIGRSVEVGEDGATH